MSQPICKDCRHFIPSTTLIVFGNYIEPKCRHPDARDMVSGRPTTCFITRHGACAGGKLFEARDQEPTWKSSRDVPDQTTERRK